MSRIQQPAAGVYRFLVTADADGARLDQYLADVWSEVSRTRVRALLDLGGVHLSGRRMRRCSQPVKAGDQIEVHVDGQPLEPMALTDLHVLYRDGDLLVLDKPAGMATQPTPARYQGTVYSGLQKLLAGGSRRPSIGMVQRLDRDTSGVMVFSIASRAHKKLTEDFGARRVRKLYWALVVGQPEERDGVIRSQLARRRSTNRMVSVERGGKPAETRYRVLASNGAVSLLEVELVTGRSHQIRVHLSEAGHPLLGDSGYGGDTSFEGMQVPRQMLHSRTLTLQHPVHGDRMTFQATVPDDFRAIMAACGGIPTPERFEEDSTTAC